MTDTYEDFIPRNLDSDIQKILYDFSTRIDELVNFGSIIIKWRIVKPIINEEELPAILFLRNFLEQIDAISNLVKCSSIEPCNILLRTALENLLSLEYLLEKDTFNRSMSFLVWNIYENNKNIERLHPPTDEYKKIETLFSKDKLMASQTPPIFGDAGKLLSIGDKILNTPKYLPFKLEYDKTKAKIKRGLHWYSLFNGPKSIRELAEVLGQPVLYDGFFRSYSASTHGTDIIQGKLFGHDDGTTGILQIRVPTNAQTVTNSCFNLCIMAYQLIVKNQLPEKQTEFNSWWLDIQKTINELRQKQFIMTK